MDDIYKNVEEYKPNINNILIVFDMIIDMLNTNILNLIATELFIRGGKLNISPLFITHSYFFALKYIRVSFSQYFMKIPDKWGLQEIAFNYSSDLDFNPVQDGPFWGCSQFLMHNLQWWKLAQLHLT